MDVALIGATAGLGLAAVDVVGIAFMPILLAQTNGVRRATVFLLGSFVALLTMGMVFTTGLGSVVVDIQHRYPWLVPGVEVFGGVVLLVLGVVMLVRARNGSSTHAPDNLVERLNLPEPLLFGFGAVLVAIQSVIDVVFVVAMVDVGARELPLYEVVANVLAYAVAALAIQVAVVVAYVVTPHERREHVMAAFSDWLARKGEFWAGLIALGLGIALLFLSGPHLIDAIRTVGGGGGQGAESAEPVQVVDHGTTMPPEMCRTRCSR